MPWERRNVPVCDVPDCDREGDVVLPVKVVFPPEVAAHWPELADLSGQRSFLICTHHMERCSLLGVARMLIGEAPKRRRRGVEVATPAQLRRRRA